MSGFASFLIGMGQGALRERDRQEDMADRQQRRELLKMQVDKVKQEKADNDALRAAGADVLPVEQTTTPMGQVAENGPNLPANPDPVTEYKVGDRFTYDAGEAQRMAAEQNTPKARVGRQVTALQRMGNPTAAGALQTQQLQLDEAMAKRLDTEFDRSLAGLSTPDDIAKLVSESQNDGMGGNLKIKAVPSADGKKVAYHRLNADGSSVPTGLEFENSTKGLADAKIWLSRNTSISDKVGHLRAEAQLAAQKEARERDDARADKAFEESRRHNRVIEGIASQRAESAGSKAGAYERMPEADKLRFNALNKQIGDIQSAITKARAEGSWDGASPNGKELTTQLAALQMQANGLIEPYSKAPSSASDPLGLRSASPSGPQPGRQGAVYTAAVPPVSKPALARMPQTAPAATPADQAYQRLDAAAAKAGYQPSPGTDGKRYYKRMVNGAAQYVPEAEMAKQLGLIWD